MFAEICCGHCDSSIQFDSDWAESVWMLIYRFADAHVICGTFAEPTGLPQRSAVAVEDDGTGEGD